MKTEANAPVSPSHFKKMYEPELGLTKRELFAAMAMQGMLSNQLMIEGFAEIKTTKQPFEFMTEQAVRTADALIDQLNQKESK